MSKAKCEPGEGLRSTEREGPLTRFLASLETTLSHKGRGYSEVAALAFHQPPQKPCQIIRDMIDMGGVAALQLPVLAHHFL